MTDENYRGALRWSESWHTRIIISGQRINGTEVRVIFDTYGEVELADDEEREVLGDFWQRLYRQDGPGYSLSQCVVRGASCAVRLGVSSFSEITLRRLNIDPATYRRGHPPIAIECAGNVGDLFTIKATNTETEQTILISALRTDDL